MNRIMLLLLLTFLVATISASAQTASTHCPAAKDYPVNGYGSKGGYSSWGLLFSQARDNCKADLLQKLGLATTECADYCRKGAAAGFICIPKTTPSNTECVGEIQTACNFLPVNHPVYPAGSLCSVTGTSILHCRCDERAGNSQSTTGAGPKTGTTGGN